MRTFKSAFASFRLKKWSGGVIVTALTLILVLRYGSTVSQPVKTTEPQRQSAYSFFNDNSKDDPNIKNNGLVNSSAEVIRKPNPIKKPHFVNLEGLSDLFRHKNISSEESKALLVWTRMRSLLSRSDSLLELARGVKEGALAWKNLVSVIEKEKNSNYDSTRDRNCEFSVKAGLHKGNLVLELPCGLIVDSSVTVVGVPQGKSQGFEIELVGLKDLVEPNPPVILHYNVSLAGDNATHDSVIVQNTWTSDFGWGKEDRCPDSSANEQRVDGLSLCNQQAIRRSTVEKIQNNSNPSSETITHGAHERPNFPFVEGNPFTATLWVGIEGFHMTVNGRHETSFAYRELQKLEKWSVSGVKVSGGLKTLSAVATGLPISEDPDLVAEKHLKAPPVISGKRLVILVGVFSTGNNFKRRMALRRTWMQYEAIRSGKVAVRFLIGLHKNTQVNFELWKEAQAYGDIQFMPFVDYYGLISLKTIALCILGTKILPAKYIMKTDDDAFVRIDEVLTSLKGKPTNGLLYGLIASDSSPDREEGSKWYISKKEWPHDTYPPWAHGPGYIISRDIAKFVVQGHHERDLSFFKLEDVAMGIWIERYKSSGNEVSYVSDEKFHNAGCENDYILAHYQSPRLVLCLWENLQKDHQAVCCD